MPINSASTVAIFTAALSVAALHAVIPSHWLSFAVVGRSRGWSPRQTLRLTALAGAGHILSTALLGLVVAAAGKAVAWRAFPDGLDHKISAAIFGGMGFWFIAKDFRGHRGCAHGEHSYHVEDSAGGRSRGFPSAAAGLFAGLTLSPCLDLLTVYVGAFRLPWSSLALLAAGMAFTTLGIMLSLVWMTLQGLNRLHFAWLDRNEGVGVGVILLAVALFVLAAS